MPKQSEGKRLIQIGLEKGLVDRVNDFRKANLGSAENVVVAAALEFFMEQWLKDNAGVRKRFEELKTKRGENAGDA